MFLIRVSNGKAVHFSDRIIYLKILSRITGGNPRRREKMTEENMVAKATHKIGSELRYTTPLGDYTVKITVKMPQDMPDELWDVIHSNYSKLEEVAKTVMAPN